MHHPATGRTFVGGPDLPPTVDGLPLAAARRSPLAESCLTTYLHPPFFGGEVGAAFGRMVSGAATVRMLGSGTMDAMAVARGGCTCSASTRCRRGTSCPVPRSSGVPGE